MATSETFRKLDGLVNATLAGRRLSTRLDVVLDRLATQVDEGYPARASGGPNEMSNVEEKWTLTERKALDRVDDARIDREMITRCVLTAWSAVERLVDLIERNEPQGPNWTGTPKGWCESCYRVEQTHQPIEHFAKWCNWCGRFHGVHDQLPTEKLVAEHLAGKRITTKLLISEGFKP